MRRSEEHKEGLHLQPEALGGTDGLLRRRNGWPEVGRHGHIRTLRHRHLRVVDALGQERVDDGRRETRSGYKLCHTGPGIRGLLANGTVDGGMLEILP